MAMEIVAAGEPDAVLRNRAAPDFSIPSVQPLAFSVLPFRHTP
jgi:hypothetical protein